MNFHVKALCLALLFVLTVLFSGCASFPKEGFPKYSYEHFNTAGMKPSIDYDLNYLWSRNQGKGNIVKLFDEKMKGVFAKSNLFSKYTPGKGTADYHFSMTMKNEGDRTTAEVLGIISGLSLTLIPVMVTDEFVFSVDVSKGDKLIKHYEYKHAIDTWIQLFLITMTAAHPPRGAVDQVWEDMILAFLHDFEGDNMVQAMQ